MRRQEAVFVDSGAWIALALTRDLLHGDALGHGDILINANAKLHTCVPVVIETFTFLKRNTNREVALVDCNRQIGSRCHEFPHHEASVYACRFHF